VLLTEVALILCVFLRLSFFSPDTRLHERGPKPEADSQHSSTPSRSHRAMFSPSLSRHYVALELETPSPLFSLLYSSRKRSSAKSESTKKELVSSKTGSRSAGLSLPRKIRCRNGSLTSHCLSLISSRGLVN